MGLLGVGLALLLYHTCVTAQNGAADQCYVDNPEPYPHFATKTPYSVVANTDDSEIKFQGCRPAQFWLNARHGTRYPDSDDILRMSLRLPQLQASILSNYEAGRSQLCARDLDNIREWSLAIDVSMDNKLTRSGERELLDMARRFQKRFPTLLGAPYSPSRHKFRTTTRQRAVESGKAFARGLFGDQPVVFPKPQKPEPLLEFYKSCDKWKSLIDDSEESRRERYKFQNSTHMFRTIAEVSRRIGFVGNISLGDVRLMYDICRYDNSRDPDSVSAWCAVFSEHDLKVFEFDNDLEHFWVDGYGFPLNYQQACPLVKDFIDKFRAVVSGEKEPPSAYLYFSHLGGVLKFMARLGLFNDTEPLLSSDFGTPKAFRMSTISTFAANIAMILFECSSGFKVATYVQEQPVPLPGCTNQLCPLDDVIAQYRDVTEDCKLAEMCAENGGLLRHSWWTLLIGLPAVSFFMWNRGVRNHAV